MICIIAGNKMEAERWAEGQLLEPDEWFFPESETDLLFRKGYHTIVVGTAGQNVHPIYFERILATAKKQGRSRRE